MTRAGGILSTWDVSAGFLLALGSRLYWLFCSCCRPREMEMMCRIRWERGLFLCEFKLRPHGEREQGGGEGRGDGDGWDERQRWQLSRAWTVCRGRSDSRWWGRYSDQGKDLPAPAVLQHLRPVDQQRPGARGQLGARPRQADPQRVL